MQLRKTMSAMQAALPTLATDIVAIGGLASITYGVHMIYRPAAFIVAGVFALAFGVLRAMAA